MATIKGTWKWNGNIRDPWYGQSTKSATIAFKSGEESFSSITVTASFLNHAIIHYDEIEVQSCELIWEEGVLIDCIDTFDENYRLMDFGESEQEIDADLYDFIIANAHKWNISDKLKIIAENEQKVFNSGRDEGYQDGYGSGHGDGYTEGFDAGKQAEYDAFWDKFQANGKRTRYRACFGGEIWNNGLLNPKYDMYVNDAIYMFYFNTMGGDLVEYFKNIGKVLSFEGAGDKNLNSVFQYSNFTRVGKMHSSSASWYSTFADCAYLVTIDEVGNYDENGNVQLTTSTFSNCPALENITIRGKISGSTDFKSSTKLSRASIENIINHLSNTASGKTLTLSQTAVDREFKGVSGADFTTVVEGSVSAEWLGLVSTKPNWTITLV